MLHCYGAGPCTASFCPCHPALHRATIIQALSRSTNRQHPRSQALGPVLGPVKEYALNDQPAAEPIIIKKYANRRLYNTGTSTYVTLEDLATMVKGGEDFLVEDAKTGEPGRG